MATRVNIDTFHFGSRGRALRWQTTRRHPAAFALNRLQWYYYPKFMKIPRFPLHVDFEVSALCNMACPMCFRQHADYDPSAFGLMDIDIYRKGIDECAAFGLYSIRLSWRGECTTHPQLPDIISYARSKGIKEISFITNGYRLDGALSEDIVRAGVDYIVVSVDGLHEQYDRIRHPATFAGTVKRLRRLRRLRETVGRGFPRIRINSVWKESYGMGWFQNMYDYFCDIADHMTFTPEYIYDGLPKVLKPDFTCQYPFQRISVMWDGTIPLCISDKNGDYLLGNLRRDTIHDVWRGKKMQNARQRHTHHKADGLACCRQCNRPFTLQTGNIQLR